MVGRDTTITVMADLPKNPRNYPDTVVLFPNSTMCQDFLAFRCASASEHSMPDRPGSGNHTAVVGGIHRKQEAMWAP